MRRCVPFLLASSAMLAAASLTHCGEFGADAFGGDDDAGEWPTPSHDGGPRDADADSELPLIDGLSAIGLAAGGAHTCAFDDQGAVYCWGSNEFGQLGLPLEIAATSVPRRVELENAKVVAIAAGAAHTCAVTEVGSVLCWGRNARGQLGRPAAALLGAGPAVVPNALTGVPFLSVWATDDNTCASYLEPQIEDDAGIADGAAPPNERIVRVACWGDNSQRQLAREDVEATHEASIVRRGNSPVIVGDFALGSAFGVGALRVSGTFRAQSWGKDLLASADAATSIGTPTSVPAGEGTYFDDLLAVAAGSGHACALARHYDDLPDAGGDPDAEPADDAGDAEPGDASSEPSDAAPAPATSARLACWGKNHRGQLLRDGAEATPAYVGTFATTTRLALGGDVTCVIENGELGCAGANDDGQLGIGTFDSDPHVERAPIGALRNLVVNASVGGKHTCALVLLRPNQPRVACWGDNHDGQLGDAISLGTGYANGEFRSPSPVYVVPSDTRQPTAFRRRPQP